jgi:hypothetical protein
MNSPLEPPRAPPKYRARSFVGFGRLKKRRRLKARGARGVGDEMQPQQPAVHPIGCSRAFNACVQTGARDAIANEGQEATRSNPKDACFAHAGFSAMELQKPKNNTRSAPSLAKIQNLEQQLQWGVQTGGFHKRRRRRLLARRAFAGRRGAGGAGGRGRGGGRRSGRAAPAAAAAAGALGRRGRAGASALFGRRRGSSTTR